MFDARFTLCPSFAISLMGKRKLVALLYSYLPGAFKL